MDHAKIAFPRLQVYNKIIFGLGKLPVTFTIMIMDGHIDERYAQHSNELWSNDPNFTIGSLLWLLQMLEVVLISKSKLLFKHSPQNSFSARLLQGKSCWVCELQTLNQTIGAKPLLSKFVTSNA
jgi:hypothetical protein